MPLRIGSVALSLFLILLAGCASDEARPPETPPPKEPPLTAGVQLSAVSFSQLPDWERDRFREAFPALHRSCTRLERRAADQALMAGDPRFGRVSHWQQICAAAKRTSSDDRHVRRFFEEWFTPYSVENDGSPEGLFTGYYEPLLRGSWRRNPRYTVPLYRPPPNNTGAALPSRAAIRNGALTGRGLELLWVDSEVDAFFLEIQGSGRVQLETGEQVRVGYAGKNGHSYFPIGRELIRRGEIASEQMSMQAIRAWLKNNPREAPALMDLNPAVVFFRIVEGEGPIGAQGVALTAGRSIAVDPAYVPYSVPVFLDTTDPLSPGTPIRRLMIAQDTGGAIKGPIRGDVFWGFGETAAARAGLMKQPGRWYLLLPRAAAGR
jgi:membrane-bound lytic murein transglycosylase A